MDSKLSLNQSFQAISEKTAALPAYALKLIAMAAMLLDHIGAIILDRCFLVPMVEAGISLPAALTLLYGALRVIGRVSYPIFSFLLVEGFLKTRNLRKYLLRLGLFAVISEVPFDFAVFGVPFEFTYQNNILTLFICLLMLICMKKAGDKWYLSLPITAAAAALTAVLHTDYAVTIPVLVAAFYIFREEGMFKFIVCGTIILIANIQSYAPYSIIAGLLALCLIIFCYNGTEGKKLGIRVYAFYPVHLVILGIIAFLILN